MVQGHGLDDAEKQKNATAISASVPAGRVPGAAGGIRGDPNCAINDDPVAEIGDSE